MTVELTTPGSPGVVVNRHIPKSWNTFIPASYPSRRLAMCEANVKAKYTGIPGVTRQVLVYDKNPGWCIKCIKELLSWYENEWKSIPTAPEVVEAYNLVFREMFLFIHTALKNNLWTD